MKPTPRPSKSRQSKPSAAAERANPLSIRRFWPGNRTTEKPRNFGGPVRVVLAAVLMFLASQILAGVLVGIFLELRGINNLTYDINASPLAQFFYILLAEGLAVWLVFSVLKRRGLSLAAIGYPRAPKWSDVVRGAGGFAIFYVALIAITAVISFFAPDVSNQQQDVGFNHLNSSGGELLALIALVVIPPLGEETLVRGYLYSGLRQSWRFVPAMLTVSVLFGLAHLQTDNGVLVWAAAVDTFILSLVLVYLREKTGALYASILVHMANNLIAFGVHFHALL